MITIEQRIELLKGGYTPEQISQFEQAQQPAQQPAQQIAQQPAQQTAQQTAQEQQAAAQEQQAAAQEQPAAAQEQQAAAQENEGLQLIRDMLKSNQDVMQNVAKLTAAIQANALANASMPGGSGLPTAEDAIASIIAPKPKEKGGN